MFAECVAADQFKGWTWPRTPGVGPSAPGPSALQWKKYKQEIRLKMNCRVTDWSQRHAQGQGGRFWCRCCDGGDFSCLTRWINASIPSTQTNQSYIKHLIKPDAVCLSVCIHYSHLPEFNTQSRPSPPEQRNNKPVGKRRQILTYSGTFLRLSSICGTRQKQTMNWLKRETKRKSTAMWPCIVHSRVHLAAPLIMKRL